MVYIYYIYMLTFTINIPQMLAYIYIYHTWILWDWLEMGCTGWGPRSIAKLVQISPISIWFLLVIYLQLMGL